MRKNEDQIFALLKRMNETEQFMAKTTLAGMIPVLYSALNSNNQNELLNFYSKMSVDEIP